MKNDIINYWDFDLENSLNRINYSSTPILDDADAIAILTDWDDFKNLMYNYPKVFDGRNFLRDLKVKYIGK